ncbi:MAG: flavoprotein [Verrucomicrobiota bacterium]
MTGRLKSKRIILGVTGSIACYKAVELASLLVKEEAKVDVILTHSAQNFIKPLSFSSLTHSKVFTDLWDEEPESGTTHIDLADQADLVLLAPATAHILAQMAHGLAGDLLTSLLLATRAHILVAPAMNGNMWLHEATKQNVSVLKDRGVSFIEPESGQLACGYEGVGRLANVDAIFQHVLNILTQNQTNEVI